MVRLQKPRPLYAGPCRTYPHPLGYLALVIDWNPMLEAAYIYRHPISDPRKEVRAFELSVRAQQDENSLSSGAAQVYLEALTNVGFEKLVAGNPAHVDIDEAFLLSPVLPAPPHPIVLELQAGILPTPEITERLAEWSAAGFKFALDDLRPNDPRLPLLPLAMFVKVAFNLLPDDDLAKVLAQVSAYPVEVIATGIADQDAMVRAQDRGASLFQGEWTSSVDPIPGQQMSAKRGTLLHLLSRLYDPRVTPTEIERIVSQDPVLNLRLLQVANSAMYRRNRPVDSIRATIAILGLNQIATWVSVIVMSTVDGGANQSLTDTMTRAKLCELLGRELQLDPDRMFTIGLLSGFERALGVPIAELIKNLSLSPEVATALLHRRGPMGELLKYVEAHENRDWNALRICGLSVEQINEAWIAAIGWADQATRSSTQIRTPQPVSRR